MSSAFKHAYSSNGNEPILNHLYGIIDSKIKFIEYRTNEMLHNMMADDQSGHPSSDSEIGSTPGFSLSYSDNEKVFTYIERTSKLISRLLRFRSVLSYTNAIAILDLLTDDKFMNVNDGQLLELLA